jgi:hypothetical protein
MSKMFVIGIDPDTNKSGVAIWSHERGLFLNEFTLWDTFKYLLVHGGNSIVRLEAGHKDKRTWHKGGNATAKKIGSNNEIGRQIEKFCLEQGFELKLVAPCGLSNVNHETFCKITGWDLKIKTNPEKRVAGLLCYKK